MSTSFARAPGLTVFPTDVDRLSRQEVNVRIHNSEFSASWGIPAAAVDGPLIIAGLSVPREVVITA